MMEKILASFSGCTGKGSGGMGGYMIALTPEQEVQNCVAEAMEREGFAVIRTVVGGT